MERETNSFHTWGKIKSTMDHQMIDGVRNKSVSKNIIKIWLAWKILRDLYRSLLTGKLHSQKEIYLYFKAASFGTCLVFASNHGFSTLPSKATVRESSPSFSKPPTIESIIGILSVMCIVPKYHIVFCMIVILLILKFLVLVSFKTPEELLHLCFASLMEASEIPLWYVHAMCIVILNWNSAAYYLLYVCLWLITWKKDCFVHCPCSMVSKLAKLFRSTCLYTSNEAKEFVKVFFVASSSLNWIAWGQAIAKLGGVDTSQTYILFQTLLLLFWLHSCTIWTKLTRTDAVFSRAVSAVFLLCRFLDI